MGIWKGTRPVTMRQRQSRPPLARDRSALQQSAVGEVPLPVLLVTKFKQGVKLESIEALHGILICPFTGRRRRRNAIKAIGSSTKARREKGFTSCILAL